MLCFEDVNVKHSKGKCAKVSATARNAARSRQARLAFAYNHDLGDIQATSSRCTSVTSPLGLAALECPRYRVNSNGINSWWYMLWGVGSSVCPSPGTHAACSNRWSYSAAQQRTFGAEVVCNTLDDHDGFRNHEKPAEHHASCLALHIVAPQFLLDPTLFDIIGGNSGQ